MPDPQIDVAKLAELRARSDMRMTDRYGPNWRDLPVNREALDQREAQERGETR
ncbi:hypothetical protein [Actinoplanes sp. NPDC051494]|uniref:hypothetical protein n=1 Tax=Actinoplanes sp. NPDC051494 TaxID=3363907 RepID=UPI0037A12FC3